MSEHDQRDETSPEASPRRWLGGAPPWALRLALAVLVLYWVTRALVSALGALESLLVILVLSFVIASALEVPVNALARRMRRGLAALLVLGGFLLVLVGTLAGVAMLVAGPVARLSHRLPRILRRAIADVDRRFHLHLTEASLRRAAHTLSHDPASTHALWHSILQVGSLLMGLLFTFYLVAEGPAIRRALCRLVPPAHQTEVLRGLELAVEKAGSYLVSRVALAVVRALVALPVLLALHVTAAAALVVGYAVLSEFVPIVGTTVGTALPVVVALAQSPGRAVGVLVTLVGVSALRNYVLAPKISRHAVDLHPALAFASVVVAVTLFGPLAGLFAVPVLATLQAFLGVYVRRHPLEVDHHLLGPRPPAGTTPPGADGDDRT